METFEYDYNEKFTDGDHVRITSGIYKGLTGMVVAVHPDTVFPYEVEVNESKDMDTWCFHETELELDYPGIKGLSVRYVFPDEVAYFSKQSGPTPPKGDQVEHPSHYTSHPSGIECKEIVGAFPFFVGSAIKYLWRAGLKGDAVQDLRKAIKNIEMEIERWEAAK
ncbi:DUF3310 domain-containing protein [Streptomyces sp. NPDC001407]|uniref:DUF3310 domain-containing protein n=1 Tax=Streptomyces sp. NPDC001407 TaxID=3364573 RepID=UPI0036C16376